MVNAKDNINLNLLVANKGAKSHSLKNPNTIKKQLEHTRRSFAPQTGDHKHLIPNMIQHLIKKHKVLPLNPFLRHTWFEQLLGQYGITTESLPDLSFYISNYLHQYQEVFSCQLDTRNFTGYLSYNFENIKLAKNTQHYTRVHDLVPFYLPHVVKNPKHVLRKYYKLIQNQKKRGTIFIANSRQTNHDLLKFGIAEQQIKLFYCRPNPIFLQKNLASTTTQNRTFITWCSTIEPRKNIECFLSALEVLSFNNNKKELPKFIIVGNKGWGYSTEEYNGIKERIKELAKKVDISLQVNVSTYFLAELFSRSIAFVSTSIAEGFNLPAVEAAYSGAKPILTDIPVHKEIHGDHALYFQNDDCGALARLILNQQQTAQTHQSSYLDKLYHANDNLFIE